MDAPTSLQDALLTLNPSSCEPSQIYKLMTGLIVPRPVALVSTVDSSGVVNLAPFSFYSGVGSNPPTLIFCPAIRETDEHHQDIRKDTLRNIEETREFVVNVVSEPLAPGANLAAADVPAEVDEFALAKLTPLKSEVVRAPRVAESPAQMECKLLQVIYTGKAPGAGVIVLGEVLRFHLREALVKDFRVSAKELNAVGRMSGSSWVRTQDHFELIRPRH